MHTVQKNRYVEINPNDSEFNEHLYFVRKCCKIPNKLEWQISNQCLCLIWQQGIVVLLINLDGNTIYHLDVMAKPSLSVIRHLRHRHRKSNAKFNRLASEHQISSLSREEYHLSPKDGDLHSQTMLLNGKPLDVTPGGEIPTLDPIKVNSSDPIIVSPFSITFALIPQIDVPACR